MLFNSLHFFVFFPLVTLIYFSLPQNTHRRIFLLIASFYFYCVFSIPLSLLLVYSTILDYTVARIIEKSSKAWKRKLALTTSLIGNLGVLFTFKYVDFFTNSINVLAGQEMVPALHVILPMGISFYTFQTMAYTIDVYRGHTKASKNILDVALYVSFFPQLVAGPIMRAGELMPQFKEHHAINRDRILSGMMLILYGLIKKIFIAEPIGEFANIVYGSNGVMPHGEYSGLAMLLATYAFTVQIFMDFSAYSDIAIGAARILGFRLMENFKQPYLSLSIRDFWRRWHISLSTWLRDYLYISLGGNRASKFRTYINLMITMLLGGLWHGAAWNFVIWGGLHGAYLAFERLTGLDSKKPANMSILEKAVRWFITLHLVCLAWIFFRAQNTEQALDIITGIATWQDGKSISLTPLALLGVTLAMHVINARYDVAKYFATYPNLSRWVFYVGIVLCAVALAGGRSPEFIYFQF
jgi:alginate O-acetyltransferase complex protein AlgI